MQQKSDSINELRDGFFSLKCNQSLGYGEVSFSVIKTCFIELS